MPPSNHRKPTKHKRDRRGAAAVEFAICLPILTVLVLAVIEASNAVYVQQAITSAAYEASNVVSASGGTASDAQTRANSVLNSLGIKSASVSITPAVTSSTPLGTQISVTCSAPLSANLTSFGYLGALTLRSTIITVKL